MPIIAVFFEQQGDYDYPLGREYYFIAYSELNAEVEKRGARLVFVRNQSTYLGGNSFSRYWYLENGKLIRVDEPITADIIYDKGHIKPDEKTLLMNDPELDSICTDKSKTYALLPNHSPVSAVVRSADELKSAVHDIPGELIVAKPTDGAEGKGVSIVPRDKIQETVTEFPYLLQEFLDTSKGIPDIVDGTHDFRMIVINGEVVLCFVRTPPEGSLLANVAQGGKKIEVPVPNIPAEPLALLKDVEHALSRFPRRVYSIDLGRNADGTWKIIELNSMPGMTQTAEGPYSKLFQEALAELLVRSAKEVAAN